MIILLSGKQVVAIESIFKVPHRVLERVMGKIDRSSEAPKIQFPARLRPKIRRSLIWPHPSLDGSCDIKEGLLLEKGESVAQRECTWSGSITALDPIPVQENGGGPSQYKR